MKRFALMLLLASTGLFLSSPVLSQNVSTQKLVYAPGEKIIVTYSGFTGDAKDWIDIVPASYSDGQGQGNWKYTFGVTAGTMEFSGFPSGEYEVRAFFRNETTPVRARYRFRVGNVDQNLQAKTEKPTYLPSEKIKVIFSGFPGNGTDWIDIVPAAYGDGQGQGNWQYTNGAQKGTMDFPGFPEGNYEVRVFFKNETSPVRYRYPFVVSSRIGAQSDDSFCRTPLSVFYAGMGGLGSAWGRTTTEPTTMTPKGILDIQNNIGNARDALNMVRKCISFDINKVNTLISRMPSLTNVQAEAEIQQLIRELQTAIAQSTATCDHGFTFSSLFVTGVHVGAAQAHASGRMCMPAPMPMAFQTVIRNHLNTARDAFTAFLPCVPGFSLSQFDNVPLNSPVSTEAHTNIVGLHTNILWNIALTKCCCYCK